METADPIQEDICADPAMLDKWQKLLDLIAEAIALPLVFIAQAGQTGIKIIAWSGSDRQRCHRGEMLPLDTIQYCETVLRTKESLQISNTALDQRWNHGSDTASGWLAFLGAPIFRPLGAVFGAICAFDLKERVFPNWSEALLEQSAEIIREDLDKRTIQSDLAAALAEHEKSENSFRESEERFRKAFQASTAGILMTSMADGVILDANETYQNLFGYTHAELVGKTASELNIYINAEDRKHVIDKLQKGEPVRDYEMQLRTKTGESRIVRGSVLPISVGGRACLITSVYDLTSIKRLEYESRRMSERYALAIRAAQVGVWDWDIAADLLLWDDQMYRIYDATKEEFGGAVEAWRARVHPDDLEQSNLETDQALLGEKEYDTSFRIRRKDGSIRIIRAYADVIRDGAGKPVRMVGINIDITERKQLEQKLIQSEKMYKDLFNQNSAVRIIIEVETGLIFDANPAACKFYGYPREELMQMSITKINGLPLGEVLSNLESAYQQKTNGIQAKHTLANTAVRDVEVFHGPIEIQGKRCINCIVHDITDRKQMEERLLASEARYREIFHNNAAVQILVDSRDSSIVDANRAACEFYGYSLDEIRTKTVFDINPNSKEHIQRIISESTKKGSNHFVTQHIRADQSIREVEVFNGKVSVEGRALLHVIIYDITDSTRAIADLANSERRFRLFVENAPDSIIVETDARFAYVNQRTTELLGVSSQEELLGMRISSFFHKEQGDVVEEYLLALNEGKAPKTLNEETIVRPDGTHVDVEVSAVSFVYNEKNGALIYLRDITERRDFEKSQQELEWQLRQKQKLESIGTLAGGVAHEINNPINGIINYAHLIADGSVPVEQMQEYSRGIIQEGKRIAEIVKNLLSFARQERQTHSPAQIRDIIDQSVSLLRVMLKHDQITLQLEIPEDLPSIKCRSQQIQQVLMNLITNARDALNSKYEGYHENKIIRIDCIMFEQDDRRWFRITVQDNGTGIPEHVLERIFDPFYTTKPRDEGTGLGLSISHGIVKDHHGTLTFETEQGSFTRAILVLPVDNGWSMLDSL